MNPKKKLYIALGIILAVGIGLSWLVSRSVSESYQAVKVFPNPESLTDIQVGNYPWTVGMVGLKERLSEIGLPALSEEGTVLHIHQHLDVFVHGKPVTVPAGIGINEPSGFISPIHTHDDTAIVHVESPVVQSFMLGQFFDIWGVRFTQNCIGGYCTDGKNSLKVFVNGSLYSGDPRKLELQKYQEIAVVYGVEGENPKIIPSSYNFPSGY